MELDDFGFGGGGTTAPPLLAAPPAFEFAVIAGPASKLRGDALGVDFNRPSGNASGLPWPLDLTLGGRSGFGFGAPRGGGGAFLVLPACDFKGGGGGDLDDPAVLPPGNLETRSLAGGLAEAVLDLGFSAGARGGPADAFLEPPALLADPPTGNKGGGAGTATDALLFERSAFFPRLGESLATVP